MAFYKVPREMWRYVRTTSHLERRFREVRRRIKLFSGFRNEGSAMRNIYAQIEGIDRGWDSVSLW